MLKKSLSTINQSLIALKQILCSSLKIDKTIFVIIILQTMLSLPAIFYGNQDARILDIFASDDPVISMQLEGMTIPPYGNPANFLVEKNNLKIPAHWYDMRYYDIIYYGGLYLDFAYIIFAPLKALGLSTFPAAPLILKFFAYLFGVLSLLTLYNFSKRYFGVMTAIISSLFLLLDFHFNEFSHRIHPDTLLLFLGLLCLPAAVAYTKTPSKAKLIALGIIIGGIQGTKMGAPWALPLAFTAIYLTHRSGSFFKIEIAQLIAMLKDCITLGITAVISFIIITPYAILNRYYFKTVKQFYGLFSGQSPVYDQVSFLTWVKDLYAYLNLYCYLDVIGILVIFSLIFCLIKVFRTKSSNPIKTALIFSFILLFSNFLWYSLKGKHWVQIFYLMPSIAMLGIFLGITGTYLINTLKKIPRASIRNIALIILICLSIELFLPKGRNLVLANMRQINYASGLNFVTGTWIATNIPHYSKIQHDGMVYLDPALFPEQNMGSNVLQYDKIRKYKPEYIVLHDWHNAYNWIPEKLKNQHLRQCDPSIYSVRLYQDLIPADRRLWKVGSYPIPHIQLSHISYQADPSKSQDDALLIFKVYPDFYPEWDRKCSHSGP